MSSARKKICAVPNCGNSDVDGKVMISVPRDEETRQKWLSAALVTKSIKGTIYYCEDHFELEEDVENWYYFKTLGAKIQLKKGVIPHFNLNTPRGRKKRSMKEGGSDLTPSSKIKKRNLLESFKRGKQLDFSEAALLVEGEVAGNSPSQPESKLNRAPVASSPSTFRSDSTARLITRRKQKLTPFVDFDEEVPKTPISSRSHQPSLSETAEVLPAVRDNKTGSSSSNVEVAVSLTPRDGEQKGNPSRGANEGLASCHLLPCIPGSSRSRTGLLPKPLQRIVQYQRSSSSESIPSSVVSSQYSPTRAPSSDSWASLQSTEELKIAELKKISSKREALLLPLQCRFYLGIPKQHYALINECSKVTEAPPRDIMIVIIKIRTNDQHERLAYDFGLTQPRISQIFNSLLPKLSSHLLHFIFWPPKLAIVMKLPLQFRFRFSNVESIIDAFEIEINKPTSPKQQALTWSEYKKCNTIKYLISCTPLGFINFVSEGYGGRISDSALVEKSGFLNALPDGCDVLADRGFKQIERFLVDKNCKLLRPPSVAANEQLSGHLVKQSKIISSVRIHVERVISRVREFKFLEPHSRVDLKLVPLLDHAVVVACALINLQDPILY